MSKKYFIYGHEDKNSKEDVLEIESSNEGMWGKIESDYEERKRFIAKQRVELKAPEGKVIVRVDLQSKNYHTFSDGTKIRLERQFDNMNKRETEPVNAIVIDAENIPVGSEVLIHPNATGETNKIHDYAKLSGELTSSDISYYSIPEDMCFIFRYNNEWKPVFPYEKALRVFESYKGKIIGIEPRKIKDVLYVLSGDFKGNIVHCVNAAAYEVIFQDTNGQEGRLIRFRPNGDEKNKREPEAIAIRNDMNKKLKKGELLIGLSPNDAKPLNELYEPKSNTTA